MWISNFCVVNTRPDYISHGEAVRMQDEVKSMKNLDNLSCWCPDLLVYDTSSNQHSKQIQKFLAFGSTWCLSNHLTSKIRNSISKASSSQKISCSFDLTLLIHFTARLVYQLLLFFLFTSRLASSLFYWRHIITVVDKGLNKRFDFFRLKSNRGSQKAKNDGFYVALKSNLVANGW